MLQNTEIRQNTFAGDGDDLSFCLMQLLIRLGAFRFEAGQAIFNTFGIDAGFNGFQNV